MPRKPSLSLSAVLVALVAIASAVHAEQTRVAVLDFSVAETTGDPEHWTWAEGAVADILQLQLQQQGLVLLDRDLIHSVLNEQRLAWSGVTQPDQLTLARLLNAQYLVTGRVVPIDGDRVRVEAGVFSVEAIESVAAVTSEGVFPRDMASTLEAVAGQIASNLNTRVAFNPAPQRASPSPKPESLIMFYRGLDAAARAQPAQAVAYFMNAAALDNQFTVPLLWEIKAYEMAGLTHHAAIRREEIADVLRPLGITSTAPPATPTLPPKRVVAILSPLVTGGSSSLEPSSLSGELTRALLEQDQVRVFAPEGIGAAMAEHDLKLSALFDSQYAPRYGRWLAADALLLCRVNARDTNQLVVELSLANPITAAVGSRVRRVGRQSGLTPLLRSATDELLRQWTNTPTAAEQSVAAQEISTHSPAEGVADLRPVYRGLSAALARVQRESQSSGAHSALADAFAATGRPRLAAIEIERCLENLDIHAPGADKTYLGTHRWLFWSAQPARGAVGLVDKRAIDRLIEQLLTTYPDSLAAGCLHYDLAVSDWQGKQWASAATHAASARKTIRPPEKYADMDQELFAATFFLEGDSLAKLGQTNDAKAVFTKGLEYMDTFKARDFCLPYGPMIGDFFGTEKVMIYGGDRPGIRTRIEQALATLNGTSAPTESTAPSNVPNQAASNEADPPAVMWIKRADAQLQTGRYADALQSYKMALTEKATLAQCSGLRTALAELALERNRDQAVAEAERGRVEFDLPPVAVTWVEWFSLGRNYQTGRAFDLEKAASAYRATLDFLENPERDGHYQLERQPDGNRAVLREGGNSSGFDLRWSEEYDARWYNAAFYLAQCLIETGRREEAAQWLRRIALGVGGDSLPLYTDVGWHHANYNTVNLGVRAADLLKELHASIDQPKFGEAEGPYKTPVLDSRARMSAPPPPAIAPDVLFALTNALTQSTRETNESARLARLQTFVRQHPGDVVPAALTRLPQTGESREVADLIGLLEASATTADAPWIVAACKTQWKLVPLANRLDAGATALALAEEWRSHAAKNFIPPDLIHAIVNVRVRPMFAPVLDQIAGKWINHHMVVFLMDPVVAGEQSDALEAAFRDALGACLRLKLEQNDRYELPRISRIALRHGVPEAVAATVVCESGSPEQLRKALAPFLDLPADDQAALAYLRTNGSRWQWEPATRKFTALTQGKL